MLVYQRVNMKVNGNGKDYPIYEMENKKMVETTSQYLSSSPDLRVTNFAAIVGPFQLQVGLAKLTRIIII